MKKKKWLKIGALFAALVIIAGVCWFSNALVGNPVSKWLATRTAKAHLKEMYGDTDFEIERIGFNFKDTDYYAHIKSPGSEDSSFSLRIDMWGNLLMDSYESFPEIIRQTACLWNIGNWQIVCLKERIIRLPALFLMAICGLVLVCLICR